MTVCALLGLLVHLTWEMHRQKKWTDQVWDHCFTLGWKKETEGKRKEQNISITHFRALEYGELSHPLLLNVSLFVGGRRLWQFSNLHRYIIFKEESEASPQRWVCIEQLPQYCSLFLHPAPKLHKRKGIFNSLTCSKSHHLALSN